MRIIIHIFKKDVRRLWYEITVTLAMLAGMVGLDAHRGNSSASFLEYILQLLLPVGWVYVVALLIFEDGPVEDRQFWITRPYSWPVLVGAKALFVVVFIHIPLLLSGCIILAVRGFNPIESLAYLLWTQLMFACALTVPATALAAVTRNLAQFILAAFVTLIAASITLGHGPEPSDMTGDLVQRGIVCLGLTGAGIAIVGLQYARRRTALSRALTVAALLGVGLGYVYFPSEYAFAAKCALSGTPRHGKPTATHLDFKAGPAPNYGWSGRSPQDKVILAIPIQVSGLLPGNAIFDQLELKITGPQGEQWKPTEWDRQISMHWPHSLWQGVRLDRVVYERIKGAKVTLAGTLAVTFWRDKQVVELPGRDTQFWIPGVGRCTTKFIPIPHNPETIIARLVCESPSILPTLTGLELRPGPTMELSLTTDIYGSGCPSNTWLSPLHCYSAQAAVNFKSGTPRDLVSEMSEQKFVVIATERTGWAVVKYEFRDVDLQQFEVKRVRP